MTAVTPVLLIREQANVQDHTIINVNPPAQSTSNQRLLIQPIPNENDPLYQTMQIFNKSFKFNLSEPQIDELIKKVEEIKTLDQNQLNAFDSSLTQLISDIYAWTVGKARVLTVIRLARDVCTSGALGYTTFSGSETSTGKIIVFSLASGAIMFGGLADYYEVRMNENEGSTKKIEEERWNFTNLTKDRPQKANAFINCLQLLKDINKATPANDKLLADNNTQPQELKQKKKEKEKERQVDLDPEALKEQIKKEVESQLESRVALELKLKECLTLYTQLPYQDNEGFSGLVSYGIQRYPDDHPIKQDLRKVSLTAQTILRAKKPVPINYTGSLGNVKIGEWENEQSSRIKQDREVIESAQQEYLRDRNNLHAAVATRLGLDPNSFVINNDRLLLTPEEPTILPEAEVVKPDHIVIDIDKLQQQT